MYVCMYVCTCAHTPMNPYFIVHVPVLQEEESGEIIFYLKGADTVMQSIVQYNDWLEEEVWKISTKAQNRSVYGFLNCGKL